MLALWLVFLFALLWLLENQIPAQPLPSTRRRHAAINLSINALNFLILAVFSVGLFGVSAWAQNSSIGLFNLVNWQGPAAIAAAVLVYDLGNYWIHRVQHTYPLLWRLHRSHHSDGYLDVTSAFRFHPFESMFRFSIQAVQIVILGIQPPVLAAYAAIVGSVLLFSHANIRIPPSLERWLKYTVVLPSIHRVHHSVLRSEHDRNFGIGFMFWDVLFATFHPSLDHTRRLAIGLTEYPHPERQTVPIILKDPFRRD
jgi:sterol desaturase/sphingolipid hydroxylase (fatty acid hydroxylase superfamily)